MWVRVPKWQYVAQNGCLVAINFSRRIIIGNIVAQNGCLVALNSCFSGIIMEPWHCERRSYGSIIFSRLSTADWMSVAKWS